MIFEVRGSASLCRWLPYSSCPAGAPDVLGGAMCTPMPPSRSFAPVLNQSLREGDRVDGKSTYEEEGVPAKADPTDPKSLAVRGR